MVDLQRRLAGGSHAEHDDGSPGRSSLRGGHVPIHGRCERQPGAQGKQTVQSRGGRGARDFIRAGTARGDGGGYVFPGACGDRRNASVSVEHHLGRASGGLSFDAGTATISGVPTLGGSFTFTVQVSDNNSVTASKQFTLAVTSNLTITTGSPLPDATVGAPYARSLSATGGVAPYVWTVESGSLPPGLALDAAGNAIAGTPTANGSFAFTLQVADASGGSAARDYVLAVSLPPLPSVSLDGLPDPTNAADQPTFSVSLATAYPVQLTGQIVATFTADADVAIDDAAIQFPTGGRTVNFTIPAGSTTAVFSTSQMALQTGTVAGTITLNLSLQSAKGEVTETSTRTLHVLRAAPVIRGLQVVAHAGGFEVRLTAYSTPRQLTQAVVQLTPAAGSNLQTTQLTIPLTDLAATWYKSSASNCVWEPVHAGAAVHDSGGWCGH